MFLTDALIVDRGIGDSKGVEHIVRLVQELYMHASNKIVRWNDDDTFQVRAYRPD